MLSLPLHTEQGVCVCVAPFLSSRGLCGAARVVGFLPDCGTAIMYPSCTSLVTEEAFGRLQTQGGHAKTLLKL